MKIDIFNHVMPVPYLDMMKQHLKDQGILKRMSTLRMLWDIEARVRMLDEEFPDVQQVLTLSLPSPELVGGPELAPGLAPRLRRRAEIEIRDLAGARMAVRDEHRHGAHGVLGLLREAPRPAPDHAPLRRRYPVFFRPRRDPVGAARQQ